MFGVHRHKKKVEPKKKEVPVDPQREQFEMAAANLDAQLHHVVGEPTEEDRILAIADKIRERRMEE